MLDREYVVLAGHAVAAGAGAFRITALNDPVLNAMEREVVVEAAVRFSSEPLDGLRSLVGPQGERERSALRELDGRLCRLGAGWCGSGRGSPSCFGTAPLRCRAAGHQSDTAGKTMEDRATLHG